jgi:hypothetical protein
MPITRIDFDQLPETVAIRLRPRVERLGYLGEFFKCTAHQPEALGAFIDFTEAGKGALDERLLEVIALTVAGWMNNAYERHQHERLSVRLGFGREWVAAVNELDPNSSDVLKAEERRLQRLVLAILETRGQGAGELFEEAVAELGQKCAIAVLMVIGRYVTHAIIVNTLALAPPVPSIFDDGFSG